MLDLSSKPIYILVKNCLGRQNSCSKLLKIPSNTKSSSNIAEHNRDRPKASPFWTILEVPQLSPAPLSPYLFTLRSEVAANAVTNDSSIVGVKIIFSTHN